MLISKTKKTLLVLLTLIGVAAFLWILFKLVHWMIALLVCLALIQIICVGLVSSLRFIIRFITFGGSGWIHRRKIERDLAV